MATDRQPARGKKEPSPLATVKFDMPYEGVVHVIAKGTIKDGVFTIRRYECSLPPVPSVDDAIGCLATDGAEVECENFGELDWTDVRELAAEDGVEPAWSVRKSDYDE
jgi:hypothetical protein